MRDNIIIWHNYGILGKQCWSLVLTCSFHSSKYLLKEMSYLSSIAGSKNTYFTEFLKDLNNDR